MPLGVRRPPNPRAMTTDEKGKEVPARCAICRTLQFLTPAGTTCANGHGGAPGVPEAWGEKQTLQQQADRDQYEFLAARGEVEDQHKPTPRRGFSALKVALDHAKALKLAIPPAPVGPKGEMLVLELPQDIDVWTSEQLGRLYAQYAAMASYAEPQVALVDIERTEAKTAREKREAILVARGEVAGSNAAERKAQIAQDPEVVALSEVYEVADAKYTLLQSLFNSYDRGMKAVSREFSRRGMGIDNKS